MIPTHWNCPLQRTAEVIKILSVAELFDAEKHSDCLQLVI